MYIWKMLHCLLPSRVCPDDDRQVKRAMKFLSMLLVPLRLQSSKKLKKQEQLSNVEQPPPSKTTRL